VESAAAFISEYIIVVKAWSHENAFS